jgi:ribosome-binding factor A
MCAFAAHFLSRSHREITMVHSKRMREQMLEMCGEIHADDGVDPRQFFKVSQVRKKEDHKTRQLCRQVAEQIGQILSGEIGDDALHSLRVIDVVPAPNASQLLVTLTTDLAIGEFDRAETERRLSELKGRLRCEVAAAITRRKAPTLDFEIVVTPEVTE